MPPIFSPPRDIWDWMFVIVYVGIGGILLGGIVLLLVRSLAIRVLGLGLPDFTFLEKNDGSNGGEKETSKIPETLRREWDGPLKLRTLPPSLNDEEKVKDLTPEQVVLAVGHHADAHYRMLWRYSTKEEKLVLIHLAEGNLINPRNVEVIERLMRRRLIRRDPDFQIFNQSFARFVLTAESPQQIAAWEAETTESQWSDIRPLLLIAFLLVAVFVVYTGGETVNATVSVISGAIAGFPVLIRVLEFLRGGKITSLGDQ